MQMQLDVCIQDGQWHVHQQVIQVKQLIMSCLRFAHKLNKATDSILL